jgi:hypothetical protein
MWLMTCQARTREAREGSCIRMAYCEHPGTNAICGLQIAE